MAKRDGVHQWKFKRHHILLDHAGCPGFRCLTCFKFGRLRIGLSMSALAARCATDGDANSNMASMRFQYGRQALYLRRAVAAAVPQPPAADGGGAQQQNDQDGDGDQGASVLAAA